MDVAQDRSGKALSKLGNVGKGRQSTRIVHSRVRDAILSGELPAGAVISQVRLAEQLGVSPTPLREALRLLEHEGLIESEVNHRVRVAGVSVGDLEQLYAIRIELEALAVRLTVPHLDDEALAGLEELVARMEELAKAEDYESYESYNHTFHRVLTGRAGDRLAGMIEQLSAHAERYRRLYKARVARAWSVSMREHREILEACKARDPAIAAERVARHYGTVVLGLIAVIAPEHDPVSIRTALRMICSAEGVAG